MGCNTEKDNECNVDETPHNVNLNDYWIGKTEVTNAQFCKFLNESGNKFEEGVDWIDLSIRWNNEICRISKRGFKYKVEKGYENYPVLWVSWYGAKAFADWLSEKKEKEKKIFCLPSEAQWEYAAKGGKKSSGYIYSGSERPEDVAWFGKKHGNTHPVGQKASNELGIYDMSGNLWEWCYDYCESKNDNLGINSTVETDTYIDGIVNPECKTGDRRVIRGGDWYYNAYQSRNSNRWCFKNRKATQLIGFRVVRLK